MSNKRSLEEAGGWGPPRARRTPPAQEPQEPERDQSPGSSEPSRTPVDDAQDLTTGITGREPISGSPDCPRTLEELQEEVESLEAVVDQLDDEKQALKTRLNEMEFFKKFNVGDCKKWLASNFEFDRKDTPELLAGIFENYLMQNDVIDPLPHQLLIKNSARAQARRDKAAMNRSVLQQRKDKAKLQEAEARPKKPVVVRSLDDNKDPGLYGQNLYLSVDSIEDLYAAKPWLYLLDKWPGLRPTAKTPDVAPLTRQQEQFLQQNVVAIWERTHWLPIKMDNGKSPLEIKLLGRHHNRRKRRQAQLKERLELLSAEFKTQFERALLEQSIFGSRWVDTIMRRPTLWLPREGESLVDQLPELDENEPERHFHFLDTPQ